MKRTLKLVPAILLASSVSYAVGPFDVIKNTATSDCLNMTSSFFNTLSLYWSMPSVANVTRVDNPVPAITSSNAFQALTGTQTLNYYVESSFFYTPNGTLLFSTTGGGNFGIALTQPVSLGSQMYLLSIIFPTPSASSCASGTKWSVGTNGGQWGQSLIFSTSTDGMTFETVFAINDVSAICADTTKTFQQLFANASAAPSGGPSGVPIECLYPGGCGSFISNIQAATSTVTVAAFCAAFQN